MKPGETVQSILSPPRGPIRPKYELFRMVGEPGWPQDYEEIWAIGDVGTGKTSAMIDAMLVSAVNYPRARIVVLRSTLEELKSATIPDIQNRLAKLFETKFLEYIRDLNIIRVANGSEIHLFGLDTADNKLWGQQWFRAFIDQGERIRNSELIDLLHTRVRLQVRHKDTGQVGKTYVKITANWDRGRNWVWKRIAQDSVPLDEKGDIRVKTVEATVKGKLLRSAILTIQSYTVENEELSEDYFKHLILAGKMGSRAMRGGWDGDRDEGVVFPEYGRAHTTKETPDPSGKVVVCGLDHGLSHPTVFIANVVDGPIIRPYREYLRRNASAIANAEAVAGIIHDLYEAGASEVRIYADTTMWRRESNFNTVADYYLDVFNTLPYPVSFSPASNAKHARGIQQGISLIKGLMGQGRLKVNPNLTPMLHETLDSLTYDHLDRDVAPYTDIADAFRYAMINLGDAEPMEEFAISAKPKPFTIRREYA